MCKQNINVWSSILFTQQEIPCMFSFWSCYSGAAREGNVCRTAVGEQSEEEVACGHQPCGTSLSCHIFLMVQRTQGEKKASESEDKLSTPWTITRVLQTWANKQPARQSTLAIAWAHPEPAATRERFQQGTEQLCFLGRQEEIMPVGRTNLFNGLCWPKPSVGSGKTCSCSTYGCCLWVFLSPCSEADHFPHKWTVQVFWTVWVMQSLDAHRFCCPKKQRAIELGSVPAQHYLNYQ